LGFGVWGLGFGVWGLGFGVGITSVDRPSSDAIPPLSCPTYMSINGVMRVTAETLIIRRFRVVG